ncbi:NAD(P)/FAD-dependent oxidoreductase [Gordonia polyisoprenivorans]|uniref:NAD(P)/FAD-dependent oxidoreductase n=1 Tax=Gordonia polyisoprenivorans TaxID=84595 RepID=UPI00147892B3|nr:FAD-dependent oxidoreductase [Gordonia polyisoprenivorans]
MTTSGPPVPHTGRPHRVAVVGSGVAGLVAAYRLSADADVTLYEADHRLGGHAHTHSITPPGAGGTVAVDSGFIVHNDRTYPTLLRLFDELAVPTQETDMSMSVHSERTGLEYAGALGLSGLIPTARTLTRGRYLWMLGEVVRFHRAARKVLDTPDSDEPITEFVAREKLSDYFVDNFLLPLIAAVWSCDARTAQAYPARYLFTFLSHHGMLSVFGSPTWRTVVGGSITYVDAVADHLRAHRGRIRLGAPVRSVEDLGTAVAVTADGHPTERFDAVVLATHPHQALTALDHPTAAQRRVLGAISYCAKPAVLHTDISLLPRARRAWASWNYQIRADHAPTDALDGSGVAVTYDMTRLMRLPTADPRMLVTLGRTDLVDDSTILAEMTYEHPIYTTESVAAQALLPDIESDRIVFAGAYHGWGFHEDGAASGERAARRAAGSLHRMAAQSVALQDDPT